MQRHLLGERRILALERRGALEESRDRLRVEPRADVPGVAQRLALEITEQQRAERVARPLTAGQAANRELRRLCRLDLEPRARALAGLVGRVDALGDHALEAVADGHAVELRSVVRAMHQLQVSRREQALREIAAAREVGRAAQVESREVQQVEAYEHHR